MSHNANLIKLGKHNGALRGTFWNRKLMRSASVLLESLRVQWIPTSLQCKRGPTSRLPTESMKQASTEGGREWLCGIHIGCLRNKPVN